MRRWSQEGRKDGEMSVMKWWIFWYAVAPSCPALNPQLPPLAKKGLTGTHTATGSRRVWLSVESREPFEKTKFWFLYFPGKWSWFFFHFTHHYAPVFFKNKKRFDQGRFLPRNTEGIMWLRWSFFNVARIKSIQAGKEAKLRILYLQSVIRGHFHLY